MTIAGVRLPTFAVASRDFTASIVVFLVAMPLCMGIAIASGVPPEKGLITGIIGGIVVGALAGSPLQVSGPAAGLAVVVFELVRDKGLSALGLILILAGAIQLIAGILKVGGWFRAISPAVVHGMLAGIGVLIVVGQFHVLFDQKPLASGLQNLVAMPERLVGLSAFDVSSVEHAFAIGVLTIAVMLGWERFRPTPLRQVPAALVGVVVATLTVTVLGLDINRVTVPQSILGAIALPGPDLLARWIDPSIIVAAFAIAFIASAETLLSAAAVDRMHGGVRTDYNKELRAQGVGNLLCGVAGALPMTGVIVRSSANVQAGATTRLSTMLHGAWILAFVALLPGLLRTIPMAALGAILVVTGLRLVSVAHVRHLFHNYGFFPALIWAATLATVVVEDLLTGVLVGIALSLLELVPHARHLKLEVEPADVETGRDMVLAGSATFVTLPRLSDTLEAVPPDRPCRVDVSRLTKVDHTCAELIKEWLARRRIGGQTVELVGASPALAAMTA